MTVEVIGHEAERDRMFAGVPFRTVPCGQLARFSLVSGTSDILKQLWREGYGSTGLYVPFLLNLLFYQIDKD